MIDGTTIHQEALQKWVEAPPGCRTFLENFFTTCSPFPVAANYLNYLRDLELYAPTNRHIRTNLPQLVEAFHDVTGTTPPDLEERVHNYLSTLGNTKW